MSGGRSAIILSVSTVSRYALIYPDSADISLEIIGTTMAMIATNTPSTKRKAAKTLSPRFLKRHLYWRKLTSGFIMYAMTQLMRKGNKTELSLQVRR